MSQYKVVKLQGTKQDDKDENTHVRMKKSTVNRLKGFAEQYGDTIDTIANRLMDFKEKRTKK